MKREDIHRAWTPDDNVWRRWVKPVLFSSLPEEQQPEPLGDAPAWIGTVLDPLEENVGYRDAAALDDVAVVVDLPGAEGTHAGVFLAQRYGLRPVPLYNAVPDPDAIVDLGPVMKALVDGAPIVSSLDTGAPAFLLDSRRLGRGLATRAFDNRSICRPVDFPSPDTLAREGIRRAVLIADHIETDLRTVLFSWQRAGIQIWRNEEPASRTRRTTIEERWFLSRWLDTVVYALLPERENGTFGARSAGG